MLDWKSRINQRFDGAEGVAKWLDANHPGWREEEPDMVAETVAVEALGEDRWGRTDVNTGKEIEEYIMEFYIGA